MKRVQREEPIRRTVRNIILDSSNRLYQDEYLEKEISDQMELFTQRCSEHDTDPKKLLIKIENKMFRNKNWSFNQALFVVLPPKNKMRGWGWDWGPKVERAKRRLA